jgi:HlyD family secretion protein
LVKDGSKYVKAPFDEANAGEIKVGQRVRLNIDAYRGVDFPGRVFYVAPVVALNPDLSRTLDVRVDIEDGQEKFLPGMSADVTVVVEEKENVLFVPTEALVREEFTYIIENNHAVKRPVKIGIGNLNTREILNGLREGEVIVKSVAVKGLHEKVLLNVVDSLEIQ